MAYKRHKSLYSRRFQLNGILKKKVVEWTKDGFVFFQTEHERYELDCTHSTVAFVTIYGKWNGQWVVCGHYPVTDWMKHRQYFSSFWNKGVLNDESVSQSREETCQA